MVALKSDIKIDTKGLNKIRKLLKDFGSLDIMIGIFGNAALRLDGDGNSNALIGAIQYWGSATKNIPATYWLTLWIEHKAKDFQNKVIETLKTHVTKDKGAKKAFLIIASAIEGYLMDTFETEGFGTWPAIKEATKKRRKGNKDKALRLTDTGELKRNVATEVIEK